MIVRVLGLDSLRIVKVEYSQIFSLRAPQPQRDYVFYTLCMIFRPESGRTWFAYFEHLCVSPDIQIQVVL